MLKGEFVDLILDETNVKEFRYQLFKTEKGYIYLVRRDKTWGIKLEDDYVNAPRFLNALLIGKD